MRSILCERTYGRQESYPILSGKSFYLMKVLSYMLFLYKELTKTRLVLGCHLDAENYEKIEVGKIFVELLA